MHTEQLLPTVTHWISLRALRPDLRPSSPNICMLSPPPNSCHHQIHVLGHPIDVLGHPIDVSHLRSMSPSLFLLICSTTFSHPLAGSLPSLSISSRCNSLPTTLFPFPLFSSIRYYLPFMLPPSLHLFLSLSLSLSPHAHFFPYSIVPAFSI